MNSFARTTAVALCGLATSLLTALVVTVVQQLTGFSIFTWSIWLVVPVGAIATGLAAASGYYFGSLWLHVRPSPLLLIQMVVFAGATQFAIYWAEYATLSLDDGRKVSELVPFWDYLQIALTKTHYQIGHSKSGDTGEVGRLGYAIAGLQFVGFLLGGLGTFLNLKDQPACPRCEKYLRKLLKLEKDFAGKDGFARYHDALFQHPVESPKFAEGCRARHEAKAAKGVFKLTLLLFGCPACRRQLLEKKITVCQGSEWKAVDELGARLQVPMGVDLRRAIG